MPKLPNLLCLPRTFSVHEGECALLSGGNVADVFPGGFRTKLKKNRLPLNRGKMSVEKEKVIRC